MRCGRFLGRASSKPWAFSSVVFLQTLGAGGNNSGGLILTQCWTDWFAL